MIVYQLKFPNGKNYIGQTKHSVEKRFKYHCQSKKTLVSKVIKKINKTTDTHFNGNR